MLCASITDYRLSENIVPQPDHFVKYRITFARIQFGGRSRLAYFANIAFALGLELWYKRV
jgi:hypothetical protein